METETRAPSGESPALLSHGRRVLFLAFGSTTGIVLGVSSIMPMVPALAREFGVGLSAASLVITIFTLPGVVLSLFAGVLADRFGRKALLVPCLSLFCFAGVACSFADSFETLLIFRFLQGVGAAPLGVLNATIIADTWSGKSMSAMIGYNSMVLNAGTALCPALGGALAVFDWRFPFLLPLLTLPVLAVGIMTPLANPGKAGSFQAYRAEVGRIFSSRRIVGLFGITLMAFVLLYGPMITCFPVLADVYFHASPAVIGLVLASSSVGSALTAAQLGRLYEKCSARNLLLFSLALYAASLVGITGVPGLEWAVLPVFVYGMAQGLVIPNVQAQLLLAATPEQRASVMSVNGVLLRTGQTIAPLVFSAVAAGWGVLWGFVLGLALLPGVAALTLTCVPKDA